MVVFSRFVNIQTLSLRKRKRSLPLDEREIRPLHWEKEADMKKLSIMALALLISVATVSAASAPYANGSVISAKQGKELLDQGDVVLVDVRRQYEYDAGHIKGALLVPNETINAKSDPPLLPDKQAVILLYCRSGARAGVAMKNLIKRGYTHVYSMGGIINWPYGLVTD